MPMVFVFLKSNNNHIGELKRGFQNNRHGIAPTHIAGFI
jgi:hypothetical protein